MAITRIKLADHPTAPTLSRLVFGAWRLLNQPETSTPQAISGLITAALEAGITTFDHADIYGNYEVESRFGEALKKIPGARGKLQIVTKTGIRLKSSARPSHRIKSYDLSATHIRSSVENSLVHLGVDTIDVLLLHRPDWLLHPDEVANTFEALLKEGKCRSFGVSNFTPSQFDMLQSRLSFPLVTHQIELSPFHMAPLNNGVIDQCVTRRIAPMAWSPLGGGRLFDASNEQATRMTSVMQDILHRRQDLPKAAGIDHVAYAWLLAHPAGILPVLGSSKVERIASSWIAEAIQLTREEWYEIWQAAEGRAVP
jgi:predicted oxidoreductase